MFPLLTRHNPRQANAFYAAGHWRDDTLYGLLRQHAATRPNRYALRDSARRLTWRELADWVDVVALDLHQAGLKPGDRVSVWLPNRAETIAVTLACSRMGYVCNPSLHQTYTVAESGMPRCVGDGARLGASRRHCVVQHESVDTRHRYHRHGAIAGVRV